MKVNCECGAQMEIINSLWELEMLGDNLPKGILYYCRNCKIIIGLEEDG